MRSRPPSGGKKERVTTDGSSSATAVTVLGMFVTGTVTEQAISVTDRPFLRHLGQLTPPRSFSEHDETVFETLNIAIALDLVLEAGDHASELDQDEVQATLRISAQLVTLTKQIRADVRAFHAADVYKTGTGVSA